MVVILISGVQLALENPLNDPKGKLVKTLYYIDLCTTIIFAIEAILKTIAFGFAINGPHSYLKSPWNLLEFVIVIFSIISLSTTSSNLKTFKVLRVLRPLRVINRNDGLRTAV